MTNMTLKELVIQEDDFDVFLALEPAEKIEFLWDALCLGTDVSVNKQIAKLDKQYTSKPHKLVTMSLQDIQIGPYRLIVMNIDRLMILSSDNLKVIRNFVKSMWHNGFIVARRPDIRKTKDSDMMKYFMAYAVVGEHQPLSEN